MLLTQLVLPVAENSKLIAPSAEYIRRMNMSAPGLTCRKPLQQNRIGQNLTNPQVCFSCNSVEKLFSQLNRHILDEISRTRDTSNLN